MNHPVINNLLSPCQNGVVGEKSCTTQLLEYLELWTKILEKGVCVDVVYMEFAKAFNKVPHKRLIRKLQLLFILQLLFPGISGTTLTWIEHFLSERR